MDENQVIETTQEVGVDVGSTVAQGTETEPVVTGVASSDVELDAGQEETISVATAEAISEDAVTVAEVPSYDGDYDINHALINNRDASDQHPISSITGLKDRLEDIEAIKRVYSSENGLSEFRKWNDGNPDMVNRAGYFVKLVQGTENIDICTDEDDVYGIAVTNSGFVGGQVQSDKSDDPSYAMVGIAGALRVRTDGTARNGDYVVPNALGEATFSENNCGYKVISQGSYASYPYVTIAVTPQNDKISKIYGMLASGDSDSVGNLIIQIEDLESQLKENSQKVDIVVSDNESINEILKENQASIQEVTNVSQSALDTAQAAKESVASAVDAANEAAAKARQEALNAENAAEDLSDVMKLKDDMQPLVEWESGEYKGAAGIVQMATENNITLGDLVSTVSDQGSDIAAITMKSGKNGAMIQHLVSHIDKYSVGQYSTSEGLSYDEAQSILVDEYIYACTQDHIETMSADTSVEVHFERPEGAMYSYKWTPASESTPGAWSFYKEVSTATTYADSVNEGDLWYCWQDVEELGQDGNVVTTYVPGTLYVWAEGEWLAVATVSNNNRSRILSSTKQTADGLQSEVVDARGNFSSLKQNLDSMNSTIGDVKGNVSTIQQNVDDINLTINNINGTVSSLQQHADETDASLTAVTAGRFHVAYQSYIGAAPAVYDDGNKYSLMPTWNDSSQEFKFDENFKDNTNGIYYFHSDDKTKYCKIVDGGYEIYTIGNKATSIIDSRVSENEAAITDLNEFKTDTETSLTDITSKVSANESNITSLSVLYYHPLLSVNETPVSMFGTYKYNKEPAWNATTAKYEFNIDDRDDNGTYYLADENAQTYCRVVTTGSGTTLYETYGMTSSGLAAIQQQVTENKSSIGMVVEKTEKVIDENGNLTDSAVKAKGSIIVEAINGQSAATINADKIKLTGTDEISLAVAGSDQKLAQIEQTVNNNSTSISLVVQDNQVKGSVLIEAINNDSTVKINAGKVNISGFVTVTNLSTAGQTTINGGNITTGVIKSNNYSYSSGTYSTAGTSFDLTKGVIRSQKFTIDESGNVYFKGSGEFSGTITASGGTIGGFTIGTSALYNGKSSFSSTNDGVYLGTDGISLGANFSVSKTGALIAKNVDLTGSIETAVTDDYSISITGRTIRFKNSENTTLGRLYVHKDYDYLSLYGKQITLWANTINSDTLSDGSPQIQIYGSGIELWGSDGNTGIEINQSGDGNVNLCGTVLINGKSIHAVFA